jgi:hypothetical protein
MNVEIGAEAALFPEKEYISGIFFAEQTIEDIVIVATTQILIYCILVPLICGVQVRAHWEVFVRSLDLKIIIP